MNYSKYETLKKICTTLYIAWFILLILELTNTIYGTGYSLTTFAIKLMFDIFKDMANPIMPEDIKARSIGQTKAFLIFILVILIGLTLMMTTYIYELLLYFILSAITSGIICFIAFHKEEE